MKGGGKAPLKWRRRLPTELQSVCHNRLWEALARRNRPTGVLRGRGSRLVRLGLGLAGRPALAQLIALLGLHLAEPGVLLGREHGFELLIELSLRRFQVLSGAEAAAPGGALLAQYLQLLALGQ